MIGDGSLYGCGAGDSGQLGNGKRDTELLPKKVSTSQIEPVSSAACATHSTFVVTSKGALWGTGANSLGQLGLGHKRGVTSFSQVTELISIPIKKVAAGHHTAALSIDGDLYFWGTGVFGEILLPRKMSRIEAKVKDVAIGGSFGVSLDTNGKVWTWGANTSGELGIGDYEPKAEPSCLDRLQNKAVVSVSCGGAFAIALGITHSSGAVPVELLSETKKLQTMSPNSLTAQFAASAINLTYEEDDKSGTDQERKPISAIRSETEPEPRDTSLPGSGRKTTSISDVGSNSISQRDPNQHLVAALTRQRDYLEETIDKERKERKKVEEANLALKAEMVKLKNHLEQVEAQKAKETADTTMMLENLTAARQKMDEMEEKIVELDK